MLAAVGIVLNKICNCAQYLMSTEKIIKGLLCASRVTRLYIHGSFTLPNNHTRNKLEFIEPSVLSGPALRAMCAISNLVHMTYPRERYHCHLPFAKNGDFTRLGLSAW